MNKVLYVVSTLRSTGPTNQLFNIVHNLGAGVEARVATLSPEPSESLLPLFREYGIEVISHNASRWKGVLRNKAFVQRVVDEFNPDVIHTQGIRADGLVAGLSTRAKKVATLRNFPQLDYPMTYGRVTGRLMCHYHVRQLRRFDRVAGVSDAVSANLTSHFGLNRVSTVRNGVNTVRFHSVDERQKSILRADLGLSPEATIWVCTGHLSPRKNPLELIKAWRQVFLSDSSHQLIFLGDGPDMEVCRLAFADMKNVLLVGRTSRVEDYLKAADLYVSPSTAEGMPNAVLEAMACGLPVLLSDIGPHSEILALDGKVGRTYPLGCASHLADLLREFAIIDRQLITKSLENVVQNYLSAQAMSSQYQKLYERIENGSE